MIPPRLTYRTNVTTPLRIELIITPKNETIFAGRYVPTAIIIDAAGHRYVGGSVKQARKFVTVMNRRAK